MTNAFTVFILLVSLFFTGCTGGKGKPAGRVQKSKLEDKCADKGEKVKVKAMMGKTASLTYTIKLDFSAFMNGTYSFLTPPEAKVLKVFWKDNHFNILVKTESEVNSLSLVINPENHNENGFMTKCGSMLPMRMISANMK